MDDFDANVDLNADELADFLMGFRESDTDYLESFFDDISSSMAFEDEFDNNKSNQIEPMMEVDCSLPKKVIFISKSVNTSKESSTISSDHKDNSKISENLKVHLPGWIGVHQSLNGEVKNASSCVERIKFGAGKGKGIRIRMNESEYRSANFGDDVKEENTKESNSFNNDKHMDHKNSLGGLETIEKQNSCKFIDKNAEESKSKEFEKELEVKSSDKKTKKESKKRDKKNRLESENEYIGQRILKMETGLDRGLIPEKVIGIKEIAGLILLYVQWTDQSQQCELIPSKILSKKYPQIVIKFYEDRVKSISIQEELQRC
ncbi:chromobox-like protein 5 [Dinothrombium tinctorium]|uniref:Chromobox-like protein 5 n=1 Tax=Dinothrombium tinctorium TaxID=1965070 RepID=A0A3S3R3L6_9ACAR|nr:chromobox-like protein 5 [Dinothrombium tinctorium]RWS17928.1 chromobox-like protein 5 [Dinothrombium tinctorium]